ncbi:MAG: hypothetical protein LBM93_02505 [Oscillospiraceae bacterium]|nr:hypothetical protein [Oscillospiraceae bacterium]
MSNFQKCCVCGDPLMWGAFAYKQEMCYDCFIKSIECIKQALKTTSGLIEVEKRYEIIDYLVKIHKHYMIGEKK